VTNRAARCPGTTRRGTPCPRTPGPSGYCPQHDPAEASVRGKAGRSAQSQAHRAEREQRAAALAVDTHPALRELLLAARMAYVAEDTSALVRVVSVGVDLIRTVDLEAEVAELKALVVERLPAAGRRLGAARRFGRP
jgi:hypothetical protein